MGAFHLTDESSRARMARLALDRIKKRQRALRHRWHELSREEVEAELLAIGRELVEAAPLFLPRTFDSGGRASDSRNGKGSSGNGHYDGTAEWRGGQHGKSASRASQARRPRTQASKAVSSAQDGPEGLVSVSKRLLEELEQMITKLGGVKLDTEASR